MTKAASTTTATTPPLYFAQVREDSRLERELLREHRLEHIVCVASGGCTALSLLTEGAAEIDAVDLNPAQIALVELKHVALGQLSHDEFTSFIAPRAEHPRSATYERLRAGLTPATRAYWDDHAPAIEQGINHSGVTEAFYRKVGERLTQALSPESWRELIAAPSPGERGRLFRQFCGTDAFAATLRSALSLTSHLEFYPRALFAAVREHEFGDFFARRFASEVSTRSLAGNYFLSQLLFEEYAPRETEGCPAYITPEGYSRARAARARLRTHTADLASFLRGAQNIDGIFLSNVFDWAPPEERERLARAIVESAPGAIVLWRQMLAEFPLPEAFRHGLAIDERASARLTDLDRSFLYRSITVGRVKAS